MLARTAEFLLNGAQVSRAIYLGDDDAMEQTVSAWAESLVGQDPSDRGVWARLIHDKALLDEEDIYSAAFLCYGKSDGPLVKRIGQRWFLAPGPVGCAGGGAIVLDDSSDEVVATFYDAEGPAGQALKLAKIRAAKLIVQGQ